MFGKSYGPTGPQRSQQSAQARGIVPMQMRPTSNPYQGTTAAGLQSSQWHYVTGGTTSTTSNTSTIVGSQWLSANQAITQLFGDTDWVESPRVHAPLRLRDGIEKKIELPDGTIIDVAKNGSYTINDKDAKVIYRANRVRDFNAFLNASDKLEAFIRFCGVEAHVKKGEALDIPIKLFIGWLILEAAKADQEEVNDIDLLPDLRRRAMQPRCGSCGRYIRRDPVLLFCSAPCFERRRTYALQEKETRS